MANPDPLLQPFQLKGLTLKNRVVSTPHAPSYAEDGKPKERYQLYHEEKAKGGLAMTMFGGSSCIGIDSPSVFGQLYVGDDDIIPYFQEFAARIQQHDCALICQISHLGRRTTWSNGDWLPVIAPSRVREPAHRGFPKEMDKADIKRVIGYYADAARRCKEGNLNGCEVLSHGHLLDQFLSPATNRRSDEYGGSLENRLRFSIEVLEAVRKAVGDDFIIGLRCGAKEDFDGGLTLDEGIAAAQAIEATGLVDYMSVNAGHIESDYALANFMPSMWSGLAPWLPAVAAFREKVGLPLIHACRIADLATARYAIESGILDLVGMTRAHMADPHLVNKLTAGRETEIRPCVGAGYCLDRIYGEGEALCIHNVATGREAKMPHIIPKAEGPAKTIAIAGAGPAGLEAARVSAERGHRVILYEATSKLGGQILLAAKAGWRKDLIGIVDYYEQQMKRLGVEVHWNHYAELETLRAHDPDVVIIATGGTPDSQYLEGGEHCSSVWDALSGADLSGSILIYDDSGQHQAPSCADHLASQKNTDVELVTPDRHAAAEMGTLNFPIYLRNFYRKGVTVTPDHRLQSVSQEGNKLKAVFANEYGGPAMERLVDHVLVEHGTLPMEELYDDLRPNSLNDGLTDYQALIDGRSQADLMESEAGYLLFRVGDAVASRNIHAAIYDSLRLCKDL